MPLEVTVMDSAVLASVYEAWSLRQVCTSVFAKRTRTAFHPSMGVNERHAYYHMI